MEWVLVIIGTLTVFGEVRTFLGYEQKEECDATTQPTLNL